MSLRFSSLALAIALSGVASCQCGEPIDPVGSVPLGDGFGDIPTPIALQP